MQIPDEEGIVIDGFPRDVAQALSFEDQVRISSGIYSSLSSLLCVLPFLPSISPSPCVFMLVRKRF